MEIIGYVIGILVLVAILKILTLPFKIIAKFVVNSVIGGILLYICAFFGFGIIVNWWNVVLTGLFGIPGLAISYLITFFM